MGPAVTQYSGHDRAKGKITLQEIKSILRKSDIFILWLAAAVTLLLLILIDANYRQKANLPLILNRAAMVEELKLTDLCLFTEARYTRHLSQADINSAFQDNPISIEHFPAGSIAQPPDWIRTANEKMD
jgi:hypothetical protein